ncbi:MAG: hypothetical protein ABI925_10630 [Verrucomicrobiota bacterium]
MTCSEPKTILLPPMKHIAIAVFLTLLTVFFTAAQAPDSNNASAQVLALVKEVQAQQAAILANQTKIDTKLAEVAEAVRVARIFSSRGR